MNEKTVFTYENIIGKIVFAYSSPFWIIDVDGVSSVDIDISESRSNRQVGTSIAGQSVRSRSFTIDGAIFDPVIENRERVLAVIAPRTPSTLTVTQNGESWYLDVVPEKTPEITPGNGVQHFQMRLHAEYPYWRSSKSHISQIAGLISLFKFPFFTGGSWWVSKFSDSYFSTVDNKGNVPIEFRVVFTARSTLSNPELYHVDTGKKIRINKAMIAGDKITVSTVYGKKDVVSTRASGVSENGFKYLSIDSDLSMELIPGPNLLKIDATSNREGLGVRIEAPEGVRSGV